MPCLHSCLSNAAVSQLAELRQFLVPCVKCDLSMPLPVGVWGTLLSGVGDARQLERLRVNMCDKPVSIVWSFHIVGYSDVMTLNAVLVCRRGCRSSAVNTTDYHCWCAVFMPYSINWTRRMGRGKKKEMGGWGGGGGGREGGW